MNPILVANWKMYKTIEEAVSFISTIAPLAAETKAEVLVAVPFTAIAPACAAAQETRVQIGAQNMNDASEGAYTGEVSARMLKDAGASFVIVGHSERRRLFHEDNAFIQRKVKRALESNLRCILCIGETFEEHEAQETDQVIQQQLSECLQEVTSADSLLIAYEPVWAIGTGNPATPEIAERVHSKIREILGSIFGEEEAKKIPIIYGGSVSQDNAKGFLEQSQVNGLLVGSASLLPESFAKIITVCDNIA